MYASMSVVNTCTLVHEEVGVLAWCAWRSQFRLYLTWGRGWLDDEALPNFAFWAVCCHCKVLE